MPLFSDAALKKVVQESLTIPEGRTNAVVGLVDVNGVRIVAGVKLKDGHVEVTGAYEHEWDGDDSVGAKVLLSW